MLVTIIKELKIHSPFTSFGVFTGIAIMALILVLDLPRSFSENAFWTLHPLHVLVSAWVTTGIFCLNSGSKFRFGYIILIGYVGSIGIGTLSDCIIPYVGELLLNMPHAHHHIGFIEKWWLINPLALVGILLGILIPSTKFPHTIHVLLSTWASLFHISMATQTRFDAVELVLISVFLFLAVLIPCCMSDIVFPLCFIKNKC